MFHTQNRESNNYEPHNMKRLTSLLRQRAEPFAIVPFITAGYPDLITTETAIKILEEEGASIIEVGLPYSDPLADGPIIQSASSQVLLQGIKLNQIFEMLAKVRKKVEIPIVIFSYYNLLLNVGEEKFFEQISSCGVEGILIPDLPIEEAEYTLQKANEYGVEMIFLVSPNTSKERIRLIVEKAEGFIYLVSNTGTTGQEVVLTTQIQELISFIKSITAKPIMVGFGIKTPEQVTQLFSWEADGVIIGSAFIQALSHPVNEKALSNLKEFIYSIKLTINNYFNS